MLLSDDNFFNSSSHLFCCLLYLFCKKDKVYKKVISFQINFDILYL